MFRIMLSRIGLSGLIAVGFALSFLGCDDTPKFDPALQYSADTLAKEFVYEYGELKTDNGSAVRSEVPKERPEAIAKEAAKGAPTTKKAPASSLDELIAETIRKAGQINGTSKADVCKKVVEEVEKTSTIPDVDKKVIKEKLGSVAG
jgi:hypothetical protein